MYFNHAFRKSFLATDDGAGNLDQLTVGSTTDLTAGQIGLFDAKTYQAFSDENGGQPFILAQGSYFTSDIIGGNRFLGGYQESVKSKVINPKYITRVFTTCAVEPQNQIQEICVCNLECGNTYRLRLDLKGSPALRFLSHNIYRTLDAFTGCCTDDCSATCTGALVDPTIATIKWARQIVESPILSQFIKVDELYDWDGNLVASQAGTSPAEIASFLEDLDAYESTFDPTDPDAATFQSCMYVAAAYVETKFGYCTFTPTDYYELQPLLIFASMTDESGDPCNVQCFSVNEWQSPAQAQGVGETVLRDLILSGRYRQEAYPDSSRVESLRMREIEANPSLATVDRNGFYNTINILHNVPRFNNPTGTFDNDQYLLTIWVEYTLDSTSLVNQLADIINYCCPGLEVEEFCTGGLLAPKATKGPRKAVATTTAAPVATETTTAAPTV